jgi:two-component system catabolic regulation response regulator CreB
MQAVRKRVLVIEDEPSISDTIVYALESEGFEAQVASTGGAGLDAARAGGFAAIILDIGLPDMSGLDVCRAVRGSSAIPVLFLTARASEVDRVVGLELGGDDYVVKPFSPRELTARLRAILRRGGEINGHGPTPEPAASGDACPAFAIDEARYQIRYRDTPLVLSRTEFRLLVLLVRNPGRVYTRAQLMDHAWEEPEASMERTVDSHIKALRAKLRAVTPETDPIRTHRGIGYSLGDDPR